MFNRVEAKLSARSSMAQAKPSYFVVMLAYVLLTGVLSAVVTYLAGDLAGQAEEFLLQGYDAREVIEYVFFSSPDRTALYGVIQMVLTAYEAVMAFGCTAYALRLSRREQAGVPNLFEGFSRFGRVLWMSVLTYLFTMLWGMLGMIPGVILLVMAVGTKSYGLLTAGCFAVAAGSILAVVVAYRYRMAPYLLLDDPDCTARESVRRSKEMMAGHKKELFWLDLSFFGWVFLGGVIETVFDRFGLTWVGLMGTWVLLLWLTPYMNVSEANFYQYVAGLTGRTTPTAGYDGLNYDYHGSDGPAPF